MTGSQANHPQDHLEIYKPDNWGALNRISNLYDKDPRGIFYMWEPPRPGQTYVVGCDPTGGIVSWDRTARTEQDRFVDNCAIEVLRVGRGNKPDRQVAEYAGPIDAYAAASVLNTIGRMYGTGTEEGQAYCIIEVQPGPGLITLREMINKYGYINHYIWKYLDTMAVKKTSSLGWVATRRSVEYLWVMGTQHILKDRVRLHSPWLIEEMADCKKESFHSATAEAVYGAHDDRVRALFLSLWAAHDWTSPVESVETKPHSNIHRPDWQASDISYEDMMAEVDGFFDY